MNFREYRFLCALDCFFEQLTPLFVSRFKKLDSEMKEKEGVERVGGLDLEVQRRAIHFFESTIGYPVISEEIKHEWPPQEKNFILLDPLDGTHRFLMGSSHCGVMFAIVENGIVVFSALFLPFETLIDQGLSFYFAVKGSGAYELRTSERNGALLVDTLPIRTSSETRLSEASIILEGQSKKVDRSEFAQRIKAATQRSMTAYSSIWAAVHISIGSKLSLSPTLLVSIDNKPTDNLPGYLLVEEAGGKVTDLQGNPPSLENCGTLIYAANAEIHRQALEIGRATPKRNRRPPGYPEL